MSVEKRVLPEHLKEAKELKKEQRDCIQAQQILYAQMKRANRECNKSLYIESHELLMKQTERALELEKILSSMYLRKMKHNYDLEGKTEKEKVMVVAQRLEDVGGVPEIVEHIRKNA